MGVYLRTPLNTHNTHIKEAIMSTSPYELRFRLLEMAQGYLQEQVNKHEDVITNAWNLALDNGTATMELWNELQPKSYTIDDIKTTAAELKEFVENKD